MSNKLLKKVLEDISNYPIEEVGKLIKEEVTESDIYRSLFDSLQDAHIVIDKNGKIRLFNKSIYQVLPLSQSRKLKEGISVIQSFPDEDIKQYILSVIAGREKSESADFTFQHGQDMKTIRVDFAKVISDEDSFLDIRLRDISEELRNEIRLRRSESLASMTTMAAGVAHEIKNPLAAMKIHLQLMRKALSKKGSLTAEEAEKYLSVLDEETDHLNSIAVDFLFAVKPMNVELKLMSISDIVEETVSFLMPEAEEKSIKVNLNVQKYIPKIRVDSRYVRQALLNIIENAFAAMKNGGELDVALKQEGNFVNLFIKDSGTGIDEKLLSKIFEPYFTTKATGTGLGLTVVYKIMKEHGGDVHVDSEVGVGTCFKLSFPVPSSERNALEDLKDEHNTDC